MDFAAGVYLSEAPLTHCIVQNCWRNEGSMNRGMDRGRGLDIDEPFFSDSSSNLEHDEVFQISQKLELNLSE